MKAIKFFAAAALVAALAVSCNSSNEPKVDVERPTASEIDSVSYLIGVNFGSFLKGNNFAADLKELNMAEVKKGMQVFVTLDAYGDEVFKGKISRIYPIINQSTHTFQVEVTLPNSNERVRPGMFARVTLPYEQKQSVVISDRAVQKLMGSGDRYVFVYTPADSTVRYSKVELGRRLDTEFEVISGVKSGEVVVTKGHLGLTNGCKAELVK